MARLFTIDAGLREAALPTARPATLQVFRFAVAISLAGRGAIWALSVPVAAVDHGVTPPRRHLIVDPTLALTALSALTLMLRNRRRGDHKVSAGAKKVSA